MFDIGSILLILALAILVVVIVAGPFLDRKKGKKIQSKSRKVSEREVRLASLLTERERLLKTLQELDFDQTMGKVTEGDYLLRRGELLQSAAAVLRELDELEGVKPQSPAAGTPAPVEDDLEALIARHKQQSKGKSSRACSRCGSDVRTTDRFCPKCGAAV